MPELNEKDREYLSDLEKQIKRRFKVGSLSDYVEREIYSRDQTLHDVTERLDTEYQAFYRLLQKLKIVPLRTQEDSLAEKAEEYGFETLEAYFLDRYNEKGLSVRKIGKELGVSRQTVVNRMKRLGIKRRTLAKSVKD